MNARAVTLAGTAAVAFLAALGAFGSGGASADGNPTPVSDVYVEGTLVAGVEPGCVLLQGWELFGDLGGFGVGDDVRVWGDVAGGGSFCLQGIPLEVKKIAALGPVGGIAELPDADGSPLEARDSSGRSPGVVAGIAAGAVAAFAAVGGTALYAKRRLVR